MSVDIIPLLIRLCIRSGIHDTTTIDGKHAIDPLGFHVTIAYKYGDHVTTENHVVSHGYTGGQQSFDLTEATHTPEKADTTPRGGRSSGKVVWPSANLLEEYKYSPIGHSHLPEEP